MQYLEIESTIEKQKKSRINESGFLLAAGRHFCFSRWLP
jgi:hypothetical protein